MDQTSASRVLQTIESLESKSDAKCHSTASRFEDFVFGTPLVDEARLEKVELQKEFVRRIWLSSSDVALRHGESTVSAERVREQLEAVIAIQAPSGEMIPVSFPGRAPLLVPERRALQYGSIAYSLRAILAVQQEFLLTSGDPVVPLSQAAIDLLRHAIDMTTLSVLMIADRSARDESEFEISAIRLRESWLYLVPPAPRQAHEPQLVEGSVGDEVGMALLDEMIGNKVAAYRRYNDFDDRKMRALLVRNSVRFYARAPVGRSQAARAQIIAAINKGLSEFASGLVIAADARALKSGHGLIRADDAVAASDELLPQEIDEFEDVHVFPRLEGDERVTLEAFDCDSFRDFGIHWVALERALHRAPPGTRLPDPFAAEILAEAISQYGVLLLRVGGDLARQNATDVHLTPASLQASAEQIAARARRHHDAPAPTARPTGIVSATHSADTALPAKFFSDVTRQNALHFAHRSSKWLGEFRHKQVKTPPTFSGGGVAAEDIDGDSHMDLLFVGGAGNALLMGRGDGRFDDITASAGLSLRRSDGSFGEARSPIIADFDNDGLQDILITYVNDDHRLFRNLGGRRFQDVTAKSGLGGKGLIAGPATVFDFDSDGLLDIYVGYFGDYLHGAIPTFDRDNRGALPNKLFRNRGGLRFEDVTRKSGTGDPGWTQAVAHVDFDRDGWQDIIVANDYGRNSFFRNLGDGRFENLAPSFGMTKPYHSMNVGISDLNVDGFPDIYISNLATLVKDNKYVFPDVNTPLDFDLRSMANMLVKESDILYISQVESGRLQGYGQFTDIERGATTTGWAWDAEFLDFDHDGDDDLYLVNGTNDYNAFSMLYDHDGPEGSTPQTLLSHSRESNVFFLNEDGKLKNASARSGADLVGNSRSSVYLDFDEDGDLDIAINNFHAAATLLRNETEAKAGHWLKLRLIGDPSARTNRDAIGAIIIARAKGLSPIMRVVQGGSGYLSMDPKQQHFGLGAAEQVDIHITWPNDTEELIESIGTNRSYVIQQGSGEARVVEASRPATTRGGSDPPREHRGLASSR
jgi:hypothetical protein